MGQIPGTRKAFFILFVLVGSLTLIKFSGLYSQTAPVTTISVSNEPRGLAINTTTNRAVVTNHNTNTVTVANLTNNTTANVTVGQHPYGVAINSSTNKAYVANEKSDSVSVLNLANNTVAATIAVGGNPREIAVNSGTNTAVVANTKSDTVSILNLSNNTVTKTLSVGTDPVGVVINTTNNRAFVTNFGSDTVSVIDLATKAIVATLAVGSGPSGIAINPTTQRIVVANRLSDTVSVLNGSTNALVATVSVGSGPTGAAINATTNRAYVTNTFSDSVSVIDLSNNTVIATYPAGRNPEGIAVISQSNLLLVANEKGDTISVIDLSNPPLGTVVPVGKDPKGVALDREANVAVTANAKSNDLSVVDLSNGALLATLPAGKGPQDVAIHPTSKRLVSANSKANTASIYDLPTRTLIATIPVGKGPRAVAIDQVLNMAAVANERDGTLSLIDLSTNTVTATIPAGSHPTDIDIQPSGHLAVIANKKIDTVTIVDLANRVIVATVPVGKDPVSVAINPATNIAAVANEKSNTLSIINLSTHAVTATINVQATPTGVAINPSTNIAAVVSHETKNLQRVDLSTNTVLTPTLAAGWEPEQVVINPDTNMAIVTNEDPGAVAIIQLSNPVPVLNSLSPPSIGAGGPGFTLTLNGSKYLKTSNVKFGNQTLTSQFVSNNQITTLVPSSAIAQTGTVQVSVTNPAPGGGTSGSLAFTINNTANNPVPSISSLSPPSAIAGSAGFTLTVTGTNFISASSISFNGQSLTTTYGGGTQLTASVPASAVATAGSFSVTVTNPAPGGGTSNAQTFTVNNPAPTTTSISPTSVLAGSAATSLMVNGTNFVGSSTVRFNGTSLTTTYVNATRLTATIPAGQLPLAGTFTVTVVNPAPGGGTSNVQTFTVNNPVPTTTSIAPTSVIAGSAAFTLTLNGTNFVSASSVTLNGQPLTTTYVSATQVTAAVQASAVATAGVLSVTVTNPTPGGGVSNVQTLTVTNPVPTTTAISPSAVLAGSGTTSLTVNGTNFVGTSTVQFNGTALTTSYVGPTQLTATLPANLLASAGTFPVTVVNAAPGGGTSNSQSFTVNNPVPTIGAFSQNTIQEGSPGFALTLTGTNFVTTSTAHFAGTALATTFISSTQLTAQVPASLIASAGSFPVTVTNAAPGGGTSNPLSFTVTNPVPSISAISPTLVVTGSGLFTLTVNGSNFVTTSLIVFDGQVLTTTFVSPAQLTATVPAPDVAASHTAQITVGNPAPGGGTSNAASLIVNIPPVADAGSARSATVGKAITLDGRRSSDPDLDRITFSWSILSAPAGSAVSLVSPTGIQPSLAPDLAGSYQIQLIVNDGKADSAPAAVTVTATATNAPPNADAGFDQTSVVGQSVTLDGRRSGDPDEDRISYRWTFFSAPAGSASALTDAASVRPSFSPDLVGTYIVQLVVNDGTADSAPSQMRVVAASPNAQPMARAGKDRNGLTGSGITLDGSQSRDPNGDPLTYRWYFVSAPAGSAAALSGGTTATPVFTPDLGGEYLVRLVVNDGTSDSAPDTVLIVAASPNPAPNAVAGTDQTVHQTDTVTLDGTVSSDPNTDPVSYSWSIVSTPSGSQAALSSATAVHPAFVADDGGNYVIRLTVNDGVKNSFADTVVVTAVPITSLAVTPVNPSITQGQIQPFAATATFSDNTTKDVTTLAIWTSSNTTIATINASGVATSLKGGTTLIRAAVGSIVSPAQTLTVISLPPTIGGFAPSSGTIGTAVTITGTNFDTRTPSNNKIKFNGTPAILTSVTATKITTTVPLGATTGPITIATLGGSAASAAPFTVLAKEDFSIAAAPGAVSVVQGKGTTYQVSVSSAGPNPLTQLIALSVSGLPTGVSALFTPASATTAQGSTLTLNTTAAASAGSFTITITGTASLEGRTVTRTATVQLSVLASGGTTLAGQILASKDNAPIPGAKLKLGAQVAITDASGNFFFPAPPIGEQVILLDGPTSLYPADLAIPATIAAGAANVLPYPIYLHEISQNFTPIVPGQEAVIQPSDVPGFTMLIPPGAVIMGWDGQPNTKVSITPVPLDRIGIRPLPPQVETRTLYMFSFGKPGGGTPNQPIPIVYPNDLGAFPGERIDLWYYDESATPDPNSQQWKIYGQGTVTPDGKRIVPDPGVGMPKFCCGGSVASRNAAGKSLINDPGSTPSPGGGGPTGGDPVDLSSGMLVIEKTDLVLSGVVPIKIKRTLRSGAKGIGTFGVGGGFSYDRFIVCFGSASCLFYLPNGERYIFSAQPDGTLTNTSYPFLMGVVITPLANGTTQLRLRDGTIQIFDGLGYMIEERDRNNNRIIINRDFINRITTLVEPGGRAFRFTYAVVTDDGDLSTNSVITSITDPLDRVVRYGYTGARLATVTDPAGGITTYGYDVSNRIVTVTDPKGITYLTNEYDSADHVIKQTLADGAVYTFKYTLAGTAITQTEVTDPNGNTTIYRFNSRQYLARMIDAQGQMTRYERDFATSELTAVYDSQNRKTSFTYDLNGNATSIVDPAGNVTLMEYEPKFNRLTKIIDALENITRFAYDPSGNLTQTTDPLTHSTNITYNSAGQPVTITDALMNVTQYEYDDVGNLVATIDPLGNKTQRGYDAVSRLISITDPVGKTTGYAYNLFNRVALITDPISGLTGFTFDPNGKLLSVTDAKGQMMTYSYDVMDRLGARTDPLNRTERYAYDLRGNLKTFTDRKGQVATFTYDSLNRRVGSSFADGSNAAYAYDGMRRLSKVTDSASGTIEFGYDFLLDRLTQEVASQGIVEYSYDALGRRTAMVVNGLPPVTYTYSIDSKLTQIAQEMEIVGLGYDALGRRTSLNYQNGTSATYSYDASSRLTEILHQGPFGLIEDFIYRYDAAGNQINFSRDNGAAVLLPAVVNAAYDTANEQVRFNSSTPNLTYDANGNLTSQTDTSGITEYAWDVRGRLVGISGPSVNASFMYDARGRRTSKAINGVRTDYQYDGDDIIAEIGAGATSTTYLRGLNIDEPFIRRSASVEYYHTDALGSTVRLTDAAGAIGTSYEYDAAGKTTVTGISSNPFQYTGRENDGTDLYYYRARFYSPKLNRFISEDPIGLFGGINIYAYVGGDPINFVDPLGLIQIKRGANTKNLSEEIKGTFPTIDQTIKDHTGKEEGIITSGNDSKHLRNSKHYTNDAIDIRGNDVTDEKMWEIADDLQKRLGKDYYVKPEYFPDDPKNDHIHIQYDRKKPKDPPQKPCAERKCP